MRSLTCIVAAALVVAGGSLLLVGTVSTARIAPYLQAYGCAVAAVGLLLAVTRQAVVSLVRAEEQRYDELVDRLIDHSDGDVQLAARALATHQQMRRTGGPVLPPDLLLTECRRTVLRRVAERGRERREGSDHA